MAARPPHDPAQEALGEPGLDRVGPYAVTWDDVGYRFTGPDGRWVSVAEVTVSMLTGPVRTADLEGEARDRVLRLVAWHWHRKHGGPPPWAR